jgi:hypothetical protein
MKSAIVTCDRRRACRRVPLSRVAGRSTAPVAVEGGRGERREDEMDEHALRSRLGDYLAVRFADRKVTADLIGNAVRDFFDEEIHSGRLKREPAFRVHVYLDEVNPTLLNVSFRPAD